MSTLASRLKALAKWEEDDALYDEARDIREALALLREARAGLLRGLSACGNLVVDDAPPPIKRQAQLAINEMREKLAALDAALGEPK